MFPRSKFWLAVVIVLPVGLVAYLWSATRSRPHQVATSNSPVLSLALSRDGSMLAVQEGDGKLALLSLGDNRRFPLPMEASPELKNTASNTLKLSFSPDGKTLSAWNISLVNTPTTICSGLYAWDTQSHQIKWSLVSNTRDDASRFWLAPDGKRAIHSSYYVLKLMDVSGPGPPRKTYLSKFARTFPVLARFNGFVHKQDKTQESLATLAFSPDGKTVAVVSNDGDVECWNTATSQKQATLPPPTIPKNVSSECQLSYSPDGRFLAFLKWGYLSLWDVTAGKWTTAPANTSGGSEILLAWMPDSRSLWTNASAVQQWSVPALKVARTLPVGGPFTLSGDGKTLVTRSPSSSGTNGIWSWNIG